ncbi:MAG: D-alanyl-D-alanine carboxypeptidase/D-alanyl-D-alanine-endopeptidase [Phycisphaerales bacterium]|nr:D-alanyl-D-alanine carboxypeptidase/D-alanyl-D-alanine-endopeptidase [Phycisphaerales bacterium]
MLKMLRSRVVSVMSLALAAGMTSVPVLAQALQGEIDRLVGSAKIGKTKLGVCLIDAKTGELLAGRRVDEPFTPASNMKVLTTGAALWVLKPGFEYQTEFRLDGDKLIVVGSGDPAFGDPEILQQMSPKVSVSELLSTLARSVTHAGVKELSEVVVDDRIFDREFVHPSWPVEQLDRWYCAEVSGLIFHANVLDVYPKPGAPGQRPSAIFEPDTSVVELDSSRARSVSTGNNTVWLKREAKQNRFQMLGDVRSAVTKPVQVTLTENPLFFGQVFAERLMKEGVQVGGTPVPGGGRETVAARAAGPNDPVPGGRVLAIVKTPLTDVVRRCNVESYNLYAEALLKRIGHDVTGQSGSWETGGSVLRMLMTEKLGPEAARSTVIRDGSGMSRDNRVAAGTMARWLVELAKDESVAKTFIDSLPKPGEGTLEKRFRGNPTKHLVRAKSGYIRNVRALSGYVIDEKDNHVVAFSILANDVPGGEEDSVVLQLHEQIVAAVDKYLSRNDPAADDDQKPAKRRR